MFPKWSMDRRRDLAIVTVLAIVGVCFFGQLCKPFCNGQPHSIPVDSPVLKHFPCNASGPARAIHLIRFAPRVLYDMTVLHPNDLWYTLGYLPWLGRLSCALMLSDPLYTEFMAPLFTYATRSAVIIYHIYLGPLHVPTAAAQFYLFTAYESCCVCCYLTLQSTSAWAEALSGIVSAAAAAVLCMWYTGNPNFHVSIPRVVFTRMLMTAFNLYLHFAQRRRQLPPLDHRHHHLKAGLRHVSGKGPAGGGTAGGQGARGPWAAKGLCGGGGSPPGFAGEKAGDAWGYMPELHRRSGSLELQQQQRQEQQQQQRRELRQQQRQEQQLQPRSNMQLEAAAISAATSATPPEAAATADGRCQDGGAQLCEEGLTAASTATAAEPPSLIAFPSSAPQLLRRSPPRYRGFIRHRSDYIKVDGADPQQLGPGWQQRVEAVLAAQGLALTGAYIRQGCIELLMDIEVNKGAASDGAAEYPFGLAAPPRCEVEGSRLLAGKDGLEGRPGPAAADSPMSVAVGVLCSTESSSLLAGVCDADSICGTAADSHQHQQRQVYWSDVLEALALTSAARAVNLSSPPGGASASASQPVSSPRASPHGFKVVMAGEVPGGCCSDASGDALPRVVSLHPRVLLLLLPDEAAPTEPAVAPQLQLVVALPQAAEGAAAPAAVSDPAEIDAAAATAAAPQPPLEVLVRAQGRYLPAQEQVQHHTASPGPDGCRLLAIRVELLEGPQALTPGLLQVDLRLGGRPCCALPVLLLAPAEAMAQELMAAAAAGGVCCGDSDGDGDEEQGDMIGDLLYDLGAYLYGSQASCDATAMAAHLVAYSEACGLNHTAARVRAHCQRQQQQQGLQGRPNQALAAAAAGGSTETQPSAGAAELDTTCRRTPAAATATAAAPICDSEESCEARAAEGPEAGGRCGCSGARAPRGEQWRLVAEALLVSVGLARELPEEAEAYQSYAATWNAKQAPIIQALELAALLVVLVRSRNGSSRLATLVWLLRCGASITTALAWPLLPYAAWRRLGVAARLPRYYASLAAKALKLAMGVRSPPGFAAYQAGAGVLVMEGLLLPATCLVSPAAALLVSALRLLLNAASGDDAGCGGGGRVPLIPLRGVLFAARLEVVALATTLACHVCLRVCCRRRLRLGAGRGDGGGDSGRRGQGPSAKGGKAE